MKIKVLGTGCSNCKNLEKATVNALAEMDLAAEVEKVEDIQKIMAYGVMRTPALVIDEKVVLNGRVPSVSELKEIIGKYANLLIS
ncbi:MAG: thioredoxin family protein [Lentimicrobiaceae bacterium]|nr:thioredoxin family protein [Lentimicrobiaceae bacterium]